MRRVDITEKLSFAQPPLLVVRGKELRVRNDAATVLKVMEVMEQGASFKAISRCFSLLFDGEAMATLEELRLNIADFQTLVTEAMTLATGVEDAAPGEAGTRTTT